MCQGVTIHQSQAALTPGEVATEEAGLPPREA